MRQVWRYTQPADGQVREVAIPHADDRLVVDGAQMQTEGALEFWVEVETELLDAGRPPVRLAVTAEGRAPEPWSRLLAIAPAGATVWHLWEVPAP